MNTIKISVGSTKMIAHRGLSGLETENTCAAFVAAGNRSYFGIETDIHRTGDGNFILLHDNNTARVGCDNIQVEESSYDSLRSLRLCDKDGKKGRADLHLPSLEEYIAICRSYEKVCVLELKSDFTEDEIKAILARIEAMKWLEHVIFISFRYENLQKVRKYKPLQPCQFLTEEFSEELLARLVKDRFDLDIYYPVLTEKAVKACHERGLKVNCWTVDQKKDAQRLVSWGVDFITSNILEGEETGRL